MQSKTRQLIQQIKSKVKNKRTTKQEFLTNDAVIDHAITQLHKDLQQRGLLWAPHTNLYGTSTAYQEQEGTRWVPGLIRKQWTTQRNWTYLMPTGSLSINALH